MLIDSECNDILTELESWYARERGRYLLQCTGQALESLLEASFGYHILQLAITRGQPLFDRSPINHRIYAATCAGEAITLVCESDEIPLESDSVDAVIAHHSLEFTGNPHQVLRELQRVLTPHGQLLVIGFNPYSLTGAGQCLRKLSRNSMWREHRPVSERRLTDWLHLLGCEVQATAHLYSVPPIGGGRMQRWLTRADQWGNRHNLPLGGVYILQAIKQQSAVLRRRRKLRLPSERLIALAVPKPKGAPSPAPATPAHRQSGSRRGDAAS